MPSPAEVIISDPIIQGQIFGYTNNDYIGTQIFPIRLLAKDTEAVAIFDKTLLRDRNTEYVSGAHVNEFDYAITHAHIALHEHNATFPVPENIPGNWQVPSLTAQGAAATLAMDTILNRHEAHCANVAMTAGNYAAGFSAGQAAAWAGAAFGIIAVIYAAKLVVATAIGKEPNVFWCGADVWAAMQQNTGLQNAAAMARGFTAANPMPPSMMTQETVAAIIGADKVLVGKHLVCGDTVTTFTYTWTDCAGWAYVPENLILSPPMGFTYRKSGFPTAKMWYSDDNQCWKFAAFDYLGVQMHPRAGAVTTESGYLFTNCV